MPTPLKMRNSFVEYECTSYSLVRAVFIMKRQRTLAFVVHIFLMLECCEWTPSQFCVHLLRLEWGRLQFRTLPSKSFFLKNLRVDSLTSILLGHFNSHLNELRSNAHAHVVFAHTCDVHQSKQNTILWHMWQRTCVDFIQKFQNRLHVRWITWEIWI